MAEGGGGRQKEDGGGGWRKPFNSPSAFSLQRLKNGERQMAEGGWKNGRKWRAKGKSNSFAIHLPSAFWPEEWLRAEGGWKNGRK